MAFTAKQHHSRTSSASSARLMFSRATLMCEQRADRSFASSAVKLTRTRRRQQEKDNNKNRNHKARQTGHDRRDHNAVWGESSKRAAEYKESRALQRTH